LRIPIRLRPRHTFEGVKSPIRAITCTHAILWSAGAHVDPSNCGASDSRVGASSFHASQFILHSFHHGGYESVEPVTEEFVRSFLVRFAFAPEMVNAGTNEQPKLMLVNAARCRGGVSESILFASVDRALGSGREVRHRQHEPGAPRLVVESSREYYRILRTVRHH
jgi:hypothetical protein